MITITIALLKVDHCYHSPSATHHVPGKGKRGCQPSRAASLEGRELDGFDHNDDAADDDEVVDDEDF